MSTQTTNSRVYSIREASRLTGLPSSTLRYYESIGIVQPIERDSSSKHRTYSEEDLNILTAVSCLSATGMPLKNMREYLKYRTWGSDGAPYEVELLKTQRKQLADEAKQLEVRQQYVDLKISYWQAIETDNNAEATQIENEANKLVGDLRK